VADVTGTKPNPAEFEKLATDWLGFMPSVRNPGADFNLGVQNPGPNAGTGPGGKTPPGKGAGKGPSLAQGGLQCAIRPIWPMGLIGPIQSAEHSPSLNSWSSSPSLLF